MKKFLASFLLFMALLVAVEQVVKRKVQVGYQTHYWGFTAVDSLILYEDYTTDSMGNYVLSPLLTDTLKKSYNFETCEIDQASISSRIASVDGLKAVLADFCELKKMTKPQTEFEHFAFDLLAQKDYDKSDSAYLTYLQYPFNNSGFRSIAFENYICDKVKVLIIGDSFVWGMSADPYYNSFVDLLSARNYQVFNAGITSVDPIQYLQICKQYVSLIQPDLVIVNFYEDNDILNKDRLHQEGIPHEYITNAGFFESNPEGKHLAPQEAYEYYENLLKIPTNGILNNFMSKTAIGSILWTTFNVEKRYTYVSHLSEEESIRLTKSYVHEIDKVLKEKSVSYFFSITPKWKLNTDESDEKYTTRTEALDKIFLGLEHYIPHNLTSEDYNEPKDFHFNNSGSLKYANFIDSLIQEKLRLD